MTIRDACIDDAACLDALLTKLIREESYYDENLEKSCVIIGNYAQKTGLEGQKLLVAEQEGEIVGYLYGFLWHIPDIFVAPVAIVDALFVERDFRRRGFARALLEFFCDFAREQGACRMELKVFSANTAALRCYESCSFRESKKYMHLEL